MSDLHHVPPELSRFVGRAEELAAVVDSVTPGRVLTLVGPGGCGKTRLAIRTCHRHGGTWSDGIFWVGLEQEPDGHNVAHRIAEGLDVLIPAGQDPVAALVYGLRDRELLIALDNCEQVLDGTARVVSAILAGCPRVAVLATSRAVLGVDGERVRRVPPMDLSDALELLLERVRLIEPDAQIDAQKRGAARRVCDRLDRLPLALELAAGWAGTLSLEQIADSLSDPYSLLDGSARTAAFRQQTLEASMHWSHDLLDFDERVLFRRLGVFEPGFASDAVVGMAGLGEPPGDRTPMKALRRLIDKSLVVADTSAGIARYRMLGVVRAYALARLEEAQEAEPARVRHLDIYLSLVEGLSHLLETDKDAWRAKVGAEYLNIRAAIEWGLAQVDPMRGRRLAAAVAWLWHLEGRGAEGVRLLRVAVERGSHERSPLQAHVLVSLALVTDTALPSGEGYEMARAAQEMAAEVGTPATNRLASLLAAIGSLASDLDGARMEALRTRNDALRAGDGFAADSSEALIGLVHVLRSEYRRAIHHLESAVDGLVRRGDRGVASSSLGWLALAAARSGDLRRAGGRPCRTRRDAGGTLARLPSDGFGSKCFGRDARAAGSSRGGGRRSRAHRSPHGGIRRATLHPGLGAHQGHARARTRASAGSSRVVPTRRAVADRTQGRAAHAGDPAHVGNRPAGIRR